jgi:serine-type D-Ala-D-Ala carboxypeptidase/endopeptidase (penicillin-binding protein 4)
MAPPRPGYQGPGRGPRQAPQDYPQPSGYRDPDDYQDEGYAAPSRRHAPHWRAGPDRQQQAHPQHPGYQPAGYQEQWAQPAPRRSGRTRLVIAAAVLAVLGLGVGLVGTRSRVSDSNWVIPPNVEVAAGPVLVPVGGGAPRPSLAGLGGRLRPMLADGRLGGRVTASVIDVASGEPIFDQDGSAGVTPASTTKLLTAAAVLSSRSPSYQIPTRVVAGANEGEVVLVGGGDPTLAAGPVGSYAGAARLDKLADQVRASLGGSRPTRVLVDASLYVGPTLGPGWYAKDATDGFTANITALMTDGARINPRHTEEPSKRYPRPDLAAGQLFAKALGLPAAAVSVEPGAGGPGQRQLGQVLSPPISRLVEMMLLESDNIIAETMARQVALARGLPASFVGGAQATRDALEALGIGIDGYGLVDGSGLSHLNHVTAQLLTTVLAKAADPDQPKLRSILSGLPVAAYSGTLAGRYRGTNAGKSAAGVVRAKTGTLTGVSTLAGVAVDVDGRLLAFSIMADQATNIVGAQVALDRAAAAIASCGCG